MSPLYALWLSLLVIYLIVTGRAEIIVDRLSAVFEARTEED
jgi:hypothetical protein